MTTEGPLPALVRPLAIVGLLLLLAIGSVALWTIVPLGWISIGAELSDGDPFRTYAVALVGAPPTMIVLALGLRRIELVYLRIRGETGGSVLEPMLIVCAVIALIVLVVWWAVGNPVTPSGPLTY